MMIRIVIFFQIISTSCNYNQFDIDSYLLLIIETI